MLAIVPGHFNLNRIQLGRPGLWTARLTEAAGGSLIFWNFADSSHVRVRLGKLLTIRPRESHTIMLISDHGFHRGTGRPASIAPIPAGHAEEHSDFGIFVLRGPGIRKDHLVHGTSVLDVAPTLLALCGLPIGEDMDGRVVTEAFETPPVVVGIPSWDDVPGDDGSHPDDLKSDPVGDRAALDQLIALGYVQKLSDNFEDAVRQTQRELDLNRAESLLDGNREADAIPILRRLCDEWPDEWRLHFRLAMACKSLGRVQELRDAVDRLQSRRDECLSARADILKWRDEIRARILARKAGQPATDTIIDEDEAEVFNAIEAEPPTTTGEPCELDATANREPAAAASDSRRTIDPEATQSSGFIEHVRHRLPASRRRTC